MIFKRAHFRGMAHVLTQQGLVKWPSKLAMDEAADEVADSFPDEEIPEVAPEDGLSEEQAAEALERLVEVSQELGDKAAAAGYPLDESLQKVAASQAVEDAAAQATIALLEKSAMETAVQTGPDIPGATPPPPELDATAEGEVDVATNPSSEVVVPQGTTSLDTKPGAVGKEETRPDQPGAQANPPMNEAAKTAAPASTAALAQTLQSFLTQLNSGTGAEKVAEMDGASLSGGEPKGPNPEPRVDVEDNLDIDGVKAPAQGKTVQDVPAKAVAGAIKPQPGGTPGVTASTPNEVAKDAKKTASLQETLAELQKTAAGRALLKKISTSCEEAKKKEKEKEEEDDEEKKEAAATQVLQNLLRVVR